MVILQGYNHGHKTKKIKLSDNEFTVMLLNGSLEYWQINWYRDCGTGIYEVIKK